MNQVGHIMLFGTVLVGFLILAGAERFAPNLEDMERQLSNDREIDWPCRDPLSCYIHRKLSADRGDNLVQTLRKRQAWLKRKPREGLAFSFNSDIRMLSRLLRRRHDNLRKLGR